MKGQFQARPQSKSINKSMRPSSRFVNSDLAQQSFKKAKEFQKQESYDKAIEQYLRALMYDPNYFQAYCNMGSCYRSQRKYLEARSMYLKSIAIKSDDVISHYNLANVQRIIGNYESSIKHYEYVIKTGQSGSQNIGSLFPNSLVNLGICFKLTQQYEKAIDCYERARKLDPNDEVIIFNQAMAIMAILQTIDIEIFSEVSKEKAAKAETLLNQLLKNNPRHEMASLKLCRVSSILDKSNENLNRIVSKLKEMLANDKSTIKDEINSELGYVLKLLKEYEKSATHYNQSFNKPKSNKIIETNIYDSASNYVNDKIQVFSEEETIKLVKQGRIDDAKQIIQRLQETNLSKHVVQLAIELELAEKESQDHFKTAEKIYNKYFTENKVEISFEKVSIEAHKLIGNVLSKQNKFKESIKHFEYISTKLKSNVQRSAVHTSLGGDYQAMGEKEKALQQYKLALEQEPDNYQLIYNVGCCLHDGGNYAESNIYFQKFLRIIRDDNKLLLPTKNIYIADCLITMAGSISHGNADQFQRYENAWKAIKQVEQGEEQSQVRFDPSKLLNFYLRWADLLQDKMLTQNDKKSQPFLQSKQTLLDVYMTLLQIPGCPDRDAILNNCAILYYQERLYVNALANLNQVTISSALSLNSLSLTYLHLGEHYMATKSIYSAFGEDSKDPLIVFNKELIQWIYGISKENRLSQLIDNQDDNKIFSRWQYSILLVDALSKKLKDIKEEEGLDQKVEEILQKVFESNAIELYLNEIDKIKLRHVLNQLTPKRTVTAGSNLEQLVSFCITKSHNIEKDLKHFLERLDNKEINSGIITLLLNTFIFINKQKSHSIRTYLQAHYRPKVANIKIDMDRRATITEDELSKQSSFSSVTDIVMNLCTWQCQLESNIVVLIHIIEKIYYGVGYKDLLEIQYHFPRHNQLEDCSMTVNRIVSLIVKVFQVKANINLKESNITRMKNQLIDEIQADFQMQMRKQPFTTITLNETLKVLTINASFSSKDECIKFVKQLQKESSNKKQLEINKNSQEINVLISGILGLRCTWNEQSPLKNAIQSLLKSPLDLYHQSIIEIDQNLCIAQESNDKVWEKLLSIEVFQS